MASAYIPLEQSPPTLSGTDPCATCGVCCYMYYVPVSGYDVWRISRSFGLDPSDFVVAYSRPPEELFTFRLCHDGDTYELALDKQGEFALGQPCVFLDVEEGGLRRCSIYDTRPAACRAYPIKSTADGALIMRPGALCPPGAWSDSEPQQPGWRATWVSLAAQFDQYRDVVHSWNRQVERHPERQFSMNQYLAYLMGVYDELAKTRRSSP